MARPVLKGYRVAASMLALQVGLMTSSLEAQNLGPHQYRMPPGSSADAIGHGTSPSPTAPRDTTPPIVVEPPPIVIAPPAPALSPALARQARIDQILAELGQCLAGGVILMVDCLRPTHSSVEIRRLEACIRSETIPLQSGDVRACLLASHW